MAETVERIAGTFLSYLRRRRPMVFFRFMEDAKQEALRYAWAGGDMHGIQAAYNAFCHDCGYRKLGGCGRQRWRKETGSFPPGMDVPEDCGPDLDSDVKTVAWSNYAAMEERDRRIVKMRAIDECTWPKIAVAMNMNRNMAARTYCEAIESLRMSVVAALQFQCDAPA